MTYRKMRIFHNCVLVALCAGMTISLPAAVFADPAEGTQNAVTSETSLVPEETSDAPGESGQTRDRGTIEKEMENHQVRIDTLLDEINDYDEKKSILLGDLAENDRQKLVCYAAVMAGEDAIEIKREEKEQAQRRYKKAVNRKREAQKRFNGGDKSFAAANEYRDSIGEYLGAQRNVRLRTSELRTLEREQKALLKELEQVRAEEERLSEVSDPEIREESGKETVVSGSSGERREVQTSSGEKSSEDRKAEMPENPDSDSVTEKNIGDPGVGAELGVRSLVQPQMFAGDTDAGSAAGVLRGARIGTDVFFRGQNPLRASADNVPEGTELTEGAVLGARALVQPESVSGAGGQDTGNGAVRSAYIGAETFLQKQKNAGASAAGAQESAGIPAGAEAGEPQESAGIPAGAEAGEPQESAGTPAGAEAGEPQESAGTPAGAEAGEPQESTGTPAETPEGGEANGQESGAKEKKQLAVLSEEEMRRRAREYYLTADRQNRVIESVQSLQKEVERDQEEIDAIEQAEKEQAEAEEEEQQTQQRTDASTQVTPSASPYGGIVPGGAGSYYGGQYGYAYNPYSAYGNQYNSLYGDSGNGLLGNLYGMLFGSGSGSAGSNPYSYGAPYPNAMYSAGYNSAAMGQAVANYALQFVGNPYVWGGNSLTKGCDCSGFVQQVFKQFGINLSRTTYTQCREGTEVSYADMQPGDVINYGSHTAIYIGNNRIVHAANEDEGIIVSDNPAYKPILTIRRYV